MFNQILKWGVKPSQEDDVNRRIEFSNVIFMALPIVYLAFMAIDYTSYLVPVQEWEFDVLTVPLMVLLCVGFLLLNKYGITYLSRLLFVLIWPILLHIIPIQLLNTPLDYSLAYPFGVAFHGILIQLMFSFRKEPIEFWLLILVNIVNAFFAGTILLYFDRDGDLPLALVTDTYYRLDLILYWLLFNLVTFYILFIIEAYIRRLNESNLLITQQRDSLDQFNKNLENLVQERTEELRSRNEQLLQHAHYNAHILRAPYCRVKGLIQLEELTHDQQEKAAIKKMLTESMQELDFNIQEIQRIVA